MAPQGEVGASGHHFFFPLSSRNLSSCVFSHVFCFFFLYNDRNECYLKIFGVAWINSKFKLTAWCVSSASSCLIFVLPDADLTLVKEDNKHIQGSHCDCHSFGTRAATNHLVSLRELLPSGTCHASLHVSSARTLGVLPAPPAHPLPAWFSSIKEAKEAVNPCINTSQVQPLLESLSRAPQPTPSEFAFTSS